VSLCAYDESVKFGGRAKRWFGPAEQPLRHAVVNGIGEASEVENPFDVDTGMTDSWIRGTATIVTVLRTDEWVDRSEFFEVTFEVELPGAENYELVQRQLVAEKAQFDWQPGIEFDILVNPNDRTKAVLA
jgi:hypothetical protein